MEIKEVKQYIDRLVSYRGSDYVLKAVILRKLEGKFAYQLELKDVKANSIVIAKLSEVEKRSQQ